MSSIRHDKFQSHKNRVLFGSASAIITNLGIIAGLHQRANAKLVIIGTILVIAIADNISDTLGIHIYQEAEGLKGKEVWFASLTNFISRLFVSLVFVFLIVVFPLESAIIYSLIWGLLLISVISYLIAVYKKTNPYLAILEHIGVAVLVVALSKILGNLIISKFRY